jgi:hypothetical protein
MSISVGIGIGVAIAVIVLGTVGAIFVFVLRSIRRSRADFMALPTFDAYRSAAGSKGLDPVACTACGSQAIFVRHGLANQAGVRNVHVCRQCGRNLYRS